MITDRWHGAKGEPDWWHCELITHPVWMWLYTTNNGQWRIYPKAPKTKPVFKSTSEMIVKRWLQ